jgi:hypothetical protein
VVEAQVLRAARRFPELTVPRRPPGIVGVYDVLILAIESGHDHDRDPLTYTGSRTGLTFDVGTFSRRRPHPP